MTLAQAGESGIEARAVDAATDGTAGASFQGKGTGGTSRLVVDERRGTIVGATFTGFETADFLHAATVAVIARGPARPAAPRGALLPHSQRGLAQSSRGLRGSERGCLNARAAL